MARRKKSDMTLAQRTAADNDKFRAELMAENLDTYERLDRGDDIDKFRRDQYREALRDAKATR